MYDIHLSIDITNLYVLHGVINEKIIYSFLYYIHEYIFKNVKHFIMINNNHNIYTYDCYMSCKY